MRKMGMECLPSPTFLIFLINNGVKMEKILNIFATFAVFILTISCQRSQIEDFIEKNPSAEIYIKNGSKLIQGKEYEIKFKIYEIKSKKYFVDIFYRFVKNNFVSVKTYPLTQVDTNIFAFKIRIPENLSSFSLSPGGEYSNVKCSYRFILPVYRNDEELEYGAASILMNKSKPDRYLDYFYYERAKHPENLDIFCSRWNYEFWKKIANFDSIRDQIKYLETNYSKHPDLPLIQLIGYTLVFDTSKVFKIIPNIIKHRKQSNLLSQTTSSILKSILYKNMDFRPDLCKELISHFVHYNPFSDFTWSLIVSGAFYIKKVVDSMVAISTLNKLLNVQTDSIYLQLNKLWVLRTFFLKDSANEIEHLIDKLTNIAYDYHKTNRFYLEGKDPFHIFYTSYGLLPSPISVWAIQTKQYEKGIMYLKKLETLFQPGSTNLGLLYLSIADVYRNMPQKDSALKYYYLANLLFPAKHFVERGIMQITKSKNIKNTLRKLSKLYPNIEIRYTDIPLVKYIDGTEENLNNLKFSKLFIFFDLTCKSCFELIDDLQEKLNSLQAKGVKFYFVSYESPDKLLKQKLYSIFGSKVISNSYDFVSFFNNGILETPMWFALDSKNKLISKGSGYSTNSVTWDQLFK